MSVRVPPGRGRRTGAVVAVVAAAVALALLGAIGTRNAPLEAPAGTSVVQVSGSGAAVGAAAPKLTAESIDGEPVELPADRPSVLFFFAGWCGSCIPEATVLGQLQRELGDRVEIVAVDIDPGDSPEAIDEFLLAAGSPQYPVVHDTTDAIRAAYGVASLDVTVITDAAGTVVYRDSVPSTLAELSDGLRRADVQV